MKKTLPILLFAIFLGACQNPKLDRCRVEAEKIADIASKVDDKKAPEKLEAKYEECRKKHGGI